MMIEKNSHGNRPDLLNAQLNEGRFLEAETANEELYILPGKIRKPGN